VGLVPFSSSQTEETFFENWILSVPESQTLSNTSVIISFISSMQSSEINKNNCNYQTKVLMAVTETCNAVFVPTVRNASRKVMWKLWLCKFKPNVWHFPQNKKFRANGKKRTKKQNAMQSDESV
jgi:hypothetical protein